MNEMRSTTGLRVVLVLLVLTLGGCAATSAATSDADAPDGTSPALGMCLPEVPDCVDVVLGPDTADTGDGAPSLEEQRAAAPELLGRAEADLPADVRVSRRGQEAFALTEDYVLGRLTVELDDDGTGTFRVVSVTIELPDGPETITSSATS